MSNSEMREQFSRTLKEAIGAQDKRRMSTMRLIMAAIKDRDIAARGTGKEWISDEEVVQVLAKMVKQRHESVRMYAEAGRQDLVQQEEEEIEIISSFLPRQMEAQEVEEACRKAVSETGAKSLRDMGRCIGWLKERYAGQMDFAKANKAIQAILAG